MFPLIATLEEFREARDMVREVMAELDTKGVPYDKNVKMGVMIEVPSAALMADILAPEVDFFSIGTNDLIQYTLAVDRDNEHVSHLYSPVNPGVLRLIQHTVKAGEANNVEVAMCGEMAGDVLYTMLLVGLGVRHLSMSPAAMVDIKKLVRSISYEDAKRVADTAMTMKTSAEIEDYLATETRQAAPEAFQTVEDTDLD